MMTIQLLGKDDSGLEDSELLTGRWQSYIDSFVADESTVDVPRARIRSPFLRRNLPRDVRDTEASILVRPGIEIKVCIRTYRLFYVTNSEDSAWKKHTPEDLAQMAKCLETRNRQRHKWLQDSLRSKKS